jgi:Tol biopolymer transport system component
MKRGVVLAMAVAAVIPAATVESARPPQLLSHSLSPGTLGTALPARGICLARANGTNAVRVTKQSGDTHSAWSPNGKYVAFSRGDVEIVVADSRGRVIQRLHANVNLSQDPTWAPKSDRIAFTGGWQRSLILIANLRRPGSAWKFLENAANPAWSPDGRTLAFNSGWGYPGEPRVEIIRLDRTDRRLVATNAVDPAWSPDGRRLAFTKRTGRGPSEIVVANADGTAARTLTASPEPDYAPAWSPDGRFIAFQREADHGPKARIIVADARTGKELWTIRDRQGVRHPSWRRAVLLPRARRARCR